MFDHDHRIAFKSDDHYQQIREDALKLTKLDHDHVFKLEDLSEINSPNITVPTLELTFGTRPPIVLVFVGDLSREQVLELLIEMRDHKDDPDVDEYDD